MTERTPQRLLNQFEDILDSEPLIDEVGFIHPSQFVTLNEGVSVSKDLSAETEFWCRDHKLGISTEVLYLLYNGARDAFMDTLKRLKENSCSSSSINIFEADIMKHSKALLLLSYDFGTAWDARKLVLSNKNNCDMLIDELLFSALLLSYAPKSERSWSHRRWIIKTIAGMCSDLQDIVGKESELVERIAEKSKMNYRTWNYRCWLVLYMSREQVLHELKKSRDWTGLHVADNSGFHYRTRLMLKMLEISEDNQGLSASPRDNVELCQLWQEELDWNKTLINRYIGREALWLHRRFLSFTWIKQFAAGGCVELCNSGPKSAMNHENTFLRNELEFFKKLSTIPDNSFEDFRAQAMLSATYILWLIKGVSEIIEVELEEKKMEEVKKVIECICPEKIFLWYSTCGKLIDVKDR